MFKELITLIYVDKIDSTALKKVPTNVSDGLEIERQGFSFRSTPLLFILAAGLSLRLWNINWGLPELYDEATPLVKAWKMWNWGQGGFEFNPHFFNYPALTFYLQFVVQVIHYFIGHLLGSYPDLP